MKQQDEPEPTTTPTPSAKELIILQMLSSKKELYGLQMVDTSGGKLKRGTIYLTLSEMEEKKWLEARQEAKTGIGLPRRLYKITELGCSVLSSATKN